MNNILFKLADVYNKEKIDLPVNYGEERLIGEIILNRIVGIAYDNLNFTSINKESYKALTLLKKAHEKQYDQFISKIEYVSSLLNKVNFKYAFLKGGYLTPTLYERGKRTSNDIDILINSNDLNKIQNILLDNGFIQGYCNNDGHIVPASRQEIIHSRMNNGETIPFLRYLNGELLEIDLNFSVDYKAKGSTDIVFNMLSNAQEQKTRFCNIMTLSLEDFLIHLCCHLYKEATTYDWVKYRRDLMLYKFSDINVMLHVYGDELFFETLIHRIKEFSLENVCYYVLSNTALIYPSLYDVAGFDNILRSIIPVSTEYLKQIYNVKDNKIYAYDVTFKDWFEATNRVEYLKEINENYERYCE